ncbi:response regulator transcription factor [Rhodopseudomonas sp. BR0G17]|uniref:response regulator transcription factor n=1 Tax=Rhodopseudomonas sp. BR0G17 TaxID=2269368 RepID=UPI0013DE951C|nr:response regulator transcription factor [Rhodopseudomonas sp. BR0G17]NEW97129.1 DNA-binding response regulator [Rhodopseudomonas sp. BR0G17]
MTEAARDTEALVFVVDDDESVRNSVAGLLGVVGLKTKCFSSARDFLDEQLPDAPSCLVLDVRLPGASGLNVQEDLARAGIPIPIIFMTAHGDIPMSVRAMKAGAIEFLPKPFRDQDMLDAIYLALSKDRARRQKELGHHNVRARYAELTPREREVMSLVAAGLVNKQIADRLSLADITVKIHRGNVMRKMGANSLADLLKMALILSLT